MGAFDFWKYFFRLLIEEEDEEYDDEVETMKKMSMKNGKKTKERQPSKERVDRNYLAIDDKDDLGKKSE